MRLIAKLIFFITGWNAKGGLPPGLKKCVLVGAPHTSNLDFIFGVGGLIILRINAKFLAKKELFWFPLGFFLKWMGGIPVDRSKKSSTVDSIVELLNNREKLTIMVPAEGTRKRVERWRTGFYYAALKANVPIVLAYLDYKKKVACVDKVFYPTGNIEEDFKVFKEYYRHITPKYSEHFDPECIKPN